MKEILACLFLSIVCNFLVAQCGGFVKADSYIIDKETNEIYYLSNCFDKKMVLNRIDKELKHTIKDTVDGSFYRYQSLVLKPEDILVDFYGKEYEVKRRFYGGSNDKYIYITDIKLVEGEFITQKETEFLKQGMRLIKIDFKLGDAIFWNDVNGNKKEGIVSRRKNSADRKLSDRMIYVSTYKETGQKESTLLEVKDVIGINKREKNQQDTLFLLMRNWKSQKSLRWEIGAYRKGLKSPKTDSLKKVFYLKSRPPNTYPGGPGSGFCYFNFDARLKTLNGVSNFKHYSETLFEHKDSRNRLNGDWSIERNVITLKTREEIITFEIREIDIRQLILVLTDYVKIE